MKHKMFSIHDRKAGAFLPPFVFPSQPMAERVFSDCVNDPQHAFGKHPEDYTLFRIAEFCDRTAELSLPSAPVSVGNGVAYLNVERDGSFALEEVSNG